MPSMNATVSKLDINHLEQIRKNVSLFIKQCGQSYDRSDTILLDVAPQDYLGAKEFFVKTEVKTLDINPASKADYIADICSENTGIIPSNYFDFVLITEVLEHTLNPFAAISEVKRILKPNGHIFLSVPFNFRIHGPLPDCWRFTEHGIRALLSDFEIKSLDSIETVDRDLMPIHYTVIAQKI